MVINCFKYLKTLITIFWSQEKLRMGERKTVSIEKKTIALKKEKNLTVAVKKKTIAFKPRLENCILILRKSVHGRIFVSPRSRVPCRCMWGPTLGAGMNWQRFLPAFPRSPPSPLFSLSKIMGYKATSDYNSSKFYHLHAIF